MRNVLNGFLYGHFAAEGLVIVVNGLNLFGKNAVEGSPQGKCEQREGVKDDYQKTDKYDGIHQIGQPLQPVREITGCHGRGPVPGNAKAEPESGSHNKNID